MKLITLVLLACSSLAFAVIKELPTLKDLPESKPSETLYVFDLDNTVVAPLQMLGSDQWFDATVDNTTAEILKKAPKLTEAQAKAEATKQTLVTWREIQRRTKVRTVEEDTTKILQGLQDQGFHVIGLTARPNDLQAVTLEQLQSVNIELNQKKLFPGNVVLKDSANQDDRAELNNGVLFAGVNAKGPLLLQLLKTKGIVFQPKQIFFVDDKQNNVDSVHTSLNAANFPHICFRYGAEDEVRKRYNDAVARVQLDIFRNLLSDRDAVLLMEARFRN